MCISRFWVRHANYKLAFCKPDGARASAGVQRRACVHGYRRITPGCGRKPLAPRTCAGLLRSALPRDNNVNRLPDRAHGLVAPSFDSVLGGDGDGCSSSG